MLNILKIYIFPLSGIVFGLAAALTCFGYMTKLATDKKKAGELTSINALLYHFIANISLVSFFFGLLFAMSWFNSLGLK